MRLLSSSQFQAFHASISDAHDSLALAWLSRATGGRFTGVIYDWTALIVQMAVGAIAGLPASAVPSASNWPLLQAGLVGALQLGFGVYMVLLVPSVDHIDNLVTCTQFFLEGTGTLLLLLAARPDATTTATADLTLTAFILVISSVFLPVGLKVYDLVLVPMFVRWREEGRCRIGVIECCSTMAMIPTLLAQFLGISALSTVDVEGLVDEGAALVEEAQAADEEGDEGGGERDDEETAAAAMDAQGIALVVVDPGSQAELEATAAVAEASEEPSTSITAEAPTMAEGSAGGSGDPAAPPPPPASKGGGGGGGEMNRTHPAPRVHVVHDFMQIFRPLHCAQKLAMPFPVLCPIQ